MRSIGARILAVGVGVGTTALGFGPSAWGAPRYTITRLNSSIHSAPNDRGQVISSTLGTPIALFDGVGAGAGTPGRDLVGSRPDIDYSMQLSRPVVNNKGQAAVSPSIPYVGLQGVVVEQGKATPIGTLGGARSMAMDINDAGQVVGTAQTQTSSHAFLYQNGQMTDLGTLPGGNTSQATAVNNRGEAVGYSDLDQGNRFWGPVLGVGTYTQSPLFENLDSKWNVRETVTAHAVLFRDGGVVDLGTLGGTSNLASDINDAGVVVGYSETSAGTVHAFVSKDGVMTDLGILDPSKYNPFNSPAGSAALAINDAGLIVGSSNTRAFLFKDGEMLDLNDLVDLPPHMTLMEAYAINNLGQITVRAIIEDPNSSLDFGDFVLSPTELGGVDYAIEAPEPTILAMPALLAAWLGARALGRRRAG